MALAAAGLIAVLAGPRLVGAVSGHEAMAVLWEERAGAAPEAYRLAEAASGLALAAERSGDPRRLFDAGYLHLRAMQAGAGEEHRAEARRLTVASLAQAPSQTNGWMRLAYLRAAAGEYEAAAQALRLSQLTGRVPPALVADRVRLGLSLLPWLGAEGRLLLARDVRDGWILNTGIVTDAVRTAEQAGFVTEALAALTEEDQRQFLRVRGISE